MNLMACPFISWLAGRESRLLLVPFPVGQSVRVPHSPVLILILLLPHGLVLLTVVI